MHELIRPLSDIGPLRDPLLIAGFEDQAGATAAAAVAYLVEQWDAEPLAEVDPDELYDFTVRRPRVRIEDGERVLGWPANRIYLARPAGAERNVILLPGTAPHTRWRAFCEAIASLMQEVGARESVVLGSFLGQVPHTRSVPVSVSASDARFGRSFGIEPTPWNYEGPVSILGVLSTLQQSAGFDTAALIAMRPFYVNADPNPHAMLALIEAIDAALGIQTDIELLREQAQAIEAQADDAVQQTPQLRGMVQALERQYDWIAGAKTKGAGTEATKAVALPSAGDVLAGVEALLREQRGSSNSGSGDRSARA